MEIRDFAERVLFSELLDDKLQSPIRLTDNLPGEPFTQGVKSPSRPKSLQLHTLGEIKRHKKELKPTLERLSDRHFRGRILHTFAHHELISLELMALALLRFPDAPKAFRRGLAQVLIDEQRHFQLYHERIKALGVDLGEEAVSDYFWRCVADAPNLAAFNARLALVFEQANIDFTRHYAPLFRQVGDAESADALDIIFEDEISHVGLGLHWFRRWRPSNEPEWDSFCQLLEPPLSPGRAKGAVFSDLGRRRAGFSEEYISALKLWGGSTGRPPIVWHGNFDFEEELIDEERRVGNAPADKSPKRRSKQRKTRLNANIAFTPLFGWLATRGDIIYCPHGVPSDQFQSLLMKARSLNPEWSTDLRSLEDRRLGGLSPWGWSPQAHSLLSPLNEAVLKSGAPIPDQSCQRGISEASSKVWDLEIREEVMKTLIESDERCPIYAPPTNFVKICRLSEIVTQRANEDSLQDCLDTLRDEPIDQWIVKRSYGSAGRGVKRLDLSQSLDPPTEGWIRRSLPFGLVAEPLVDRVADLSFHGFVESEKVRYDGEVLGYVDDQGQFLGAHVGPVNSGLSVELKRFLNDDGRDRKRLSRIGRLVIETVGKSLQDRGYYGYFGVDALILREGSGFKLYPLVEVNPRLTMGRIALGIRAVFDPRGERGARLTIYPSLRHLLCEQSCSLEDLISSTNDHAIQEQWDHHGRWRGYRLPLSDLWSNLGHREISETGPIVMITTVKS